MTNIHGRTTPVNERVTRIADGVNKIKETKITEQKSLHNNSGQHFVLTEDAATLKYARMHDLMSNSISTAT